MHVYSNLAKWGDSVCPSWPIRPQQTCNKVVQLGHIMLQERLVLAVGIGCDLCNGTADHDHAKSQLGPHVHINPTSCVRRKVGRRHERTYRERGRERVGYCLHSGLKTLQEERQEVKEETHGRVTRNQRRIAEPAVCELAVEPETSAVILDEAQGNSNDRHCRRNRFQGSVAAMVFVWCTCHISVCHMGMVQEVWCKISFRRRGKERKGKERVS